MDNRQATPDEELAMRSYQERIARALHDAHKPYCDYTYPFDHPLSSADMYRDLAHAVMLVEPPRAR